MKRLTSDQTWIGAIIQNAIDWFMGLFGKNPDQGEK